MLIKNINFGLFLKLMLFSFLMIQSQENFAQVAKKGLPSKIKRLAKSNSRVGVINFKEETKIDHLDFIKLYKEEMGLTEADEIRIVRTNHNKLGTQYHAIQYHKGIPVEYAHLKLHEKDGQLLFVNGITKAGITINPIPTLREEEGLKKALFHVGADQYAWEVKELEAALKLEENDPTASYYPKGAMVIINNGNWITAKGANFSLAWKFDVLDRKFINSYTVYVDAHNGKIISSVPLSKSCHHNQEHTHDRVHLPISNSSSTELPISTFASCKSGIGRVYFNKQLLPQTIPSIINKYDALGNAESYKLEGNCALTFDVPVYVRPKPGFTGIDEDNIWDKPEQITAVTVNDQGGSIKIHINETFNSVDRNGNIIQHGKNASFVPEFGIMSIGYGLNKNPNSYNDDYSSLDVIGHEFSHGVVIDLSGLDGNLESKALNESFCDIFGEAFEFYTVGINDWLIGTELTRETRRFDTPNTLKDPEYYKLDPNWKSSFHSNGSVQNHWFYLLVNGDNRPNFLKERYEIKGIGMAKAIKIVYNTLKNLSPQSQYQDARDISIQQAVADFGACSEEAIAVTRAWAAVGLFDLNGDKPVLIDTIETIAGKCLDPTGEISVHVKGGNQGLDFNWDNGMTGATISDLEPGKYIVTISNPTNCLLSFIDTVEVTDPDTLGLTIEATGPTTCVTFDGSLFVEVKNAKGTVHYEWYNSDGDLLSNNPIVNNLPEGYYYVKVEDSDADCFNFADIDLESESLQVTINGGGIQAKCEEEEGQPIKLVAEIVDLAEKAGVGYEYTWTGLGESHFDKKWTTESGEYTVQVRRKSADNCYSKVATTILDIQEVDCEDDEDTWSIPRLHAIDPNDITGNIGYEKPQWVSNKNELGYRIRFENDPEFATAPAQVVKINSPINPKLDMFSVELGSFGFGQFVFDVPPNSSFYNTRLDLRDSLNIYVDVTAGIDVIKKEAFWIFESIDPITNRAPEDALTGFLPVNDTTVTIYNDTLAKKGEGFVNFMIKPKSNTTTGDSVVQQASNVFDLNAAIATNIWSNVIDAIPPTSTVTSLSPTTEGTEVELSFTGIDDAGGVGVENFDLYISINKGPFNLYQANIDTTAYLFIGDPGLEYAFQTIATDYVGNQETLATEGDTYTVFSEEGVITIINPENSNYCAGDSMSIQWASTGESAVTISLSTNGGVEYTPIATDINPTEQIYEWAIPSTINCTDCVLQITDSGNALEGISSNFAINSKPEVTFVDLAEEYCTTDTIITLNATPMGGVFSGTGVNGTEWNTADLAVGSYEIGYSYQDANSSCQSEVLSTIDIKQPAIADFTFVKDSLQLTFADASMHHVDNWQWDFGDSTTSNEQNPTHTFTDGTFNICLTVQNDCGPVTFCKIITTSPLSGKLSLSGLIAKEDGTPVTGVNVEIADSNKLNAEDGSYTALLLAQQDYRIYPSKNNSAVEGLTVTDLVITQGYILGEIVFDSPYKIIAADVNNSNSVTVSDIVTSLQLILGKITTYPNEVPAWRFVPKTFEFPNPMNPFETEFPSAITIENLSSPRQNLDFVAIKMGDLNLTAAPNLANLADSRNLESITLTYENKQIPANTEILIPFTMETMEQIAGYQLGIGYEAQLMELTGVIPGQLKGFDYQEAQGLVKMAWIAPTLSEMEYPTELSNRSLFTLRFLTKSKVQLKDVLRLNQKNLPAEAVNYDFNQKPIKLKFKEALPTIIDLKVFPNPTSSKLFVQWQAPPSSEGHTLYLFDNLGHEILEITASTNMITLNLEGLSNGMYYVQIGKGKNNVSSRFIKH